MGTSGHNRVGMGVVRRKDGKPFVRNELLAEVIVIGIGGMSVWVFGEKEISA